MIDRTSMKTAAAATALIVAAAVATSACGRQGALQQPAPLFGESAKADYAAQQTKRAQAQAAKRARNGGGASVSSTQSDPTRTDSSSVTDDNQPLSTRDIKDPAQKLTPLSQDNQPGLPNPVGAPVSVTPP